MEDDERYYGRRAAEERRAAERAISREARERHEQLAMAFESRLRQPVAAE
jgi:hypothetical protein